MAATTVGKPRQFSRRVMNPGKDLRSHSREPIRLSPARKPSQHVMTIIIRKNAMHGKGRKS